MLLAGDEIGNSQGGNNNAYCQDNPIGWIDWQNADEDLLAFVCKLIAMRKAHPVLRQRRFLHSNRRPEDGVTDLFWRLPDGSEPDSAQWQDPNWRCLCVEIRIASNAPPYEVCDDEVFAVFNDGGATEVVLPQAPQGKKWVQIVDTARPALEEVEILHESVEVAAASVSVFVPEPP